MATKGAARDDAVSEWRQGDVLSAGAVTIVGTAPENWRSRLLSRRGSRARKSGPRDEAVEALVIVSQSCDIVRPPSERPYLQVAPLVRLNGDVRAHAAKGATPRFVAIPPEGSDAFADLDRVMTVEKNVAAGWPWKPMKFAGSQRRDLAAAIARFYGRPAFPNDFVDATDKLRKRILARYGKKSVEGSAVTALIEVRVRAVPSWDADAVRAILYFIVPAEDAIGIDGVTALNETFWEDAVRGWGDLCSPTGMVTDIVCVPTTYAEMDALTYRSSDPFDVEYLSTAL
jgi:hypothetical protein